MRRAKSVFPWSWLTSSPASPEESKWSHSSFSFYLILGKFLRGFSRELAHHSFQSYTLSFDMSCYFRLEVVQSWLFSSHYVLFGTFCFCVSILFWFRQEEVQLNIFRSPSCTTEQIWTWKRTYYCIDSFCCLAFASPIPSEGSAKAASIVAAQDWVYSSCQSVGLACLRGADWQPAIRLMERVRVIETQAGSGLSLLHIFSAWLLSEMSDSTEKRWEQCRVDLWRAIKTAAVSVSGLYPGPPSIFHVYVSFPVECNNFIVPSLLVDAALLTFCHIYLLFLM